MDASAADLIVALLYLPGSSGRKFEEIKGITRLEKLIFLLLNEGNFRKELKNQFEYKAYDYGPYSSEVYDLLEALENLNIIEIREEKTDDFRESIDEVFLEYTSDQPITLDKNIDIYQLNEDKGKMIWKKSVKYKFNEEELQSIVEIKKKYNNIKLRELLKYVYTNYPDFTEKSKIIDKILGFGERPDLTPFVREE